MRMESRGSPTRRGDLLRSFWRSSWHGQENIRMNKCVFRVGGGVAAIYIGNAIVGNVGGV